MASDLTVHGSEYAHLCNELHAENERLKADRDAAVKRAEAAEAALRWYADEDNYLRGEPGDMWDAADGNATCWRSDDGARARAVLAATPPAAADKEAQS